MTAKWACVCPRPCLARMTAKWAWARMTAKWAWARMTAKWAWVWASPSLAWAVPVLRWLSDLLPWTLRAESRSFNAEMVASSFTFGFWQLNLNRDFSARVPQGRDFKHFLWRFDVSRFDPFVWWMFDARSLCDVVA